MAYTEIVTGQNPCTSYTSNRRYWSSGAPVPPERGHGLQRTGIRREFASSPSMRVAGGKWVRHPIPEQLLPGMEAMPEDVDDDDSDKENIAPVKLMFK